MRKYGSIGAGAAVAAVLTHGMVWSGLSFNEPLPISTYRGFFQQVIVAIERLWSYAHGWQPMSHIRDFGHFYAPTVQLICPLIGFALFWFFSRNRVGINFWKPIAIALLLAVPTGFTALTSAYALPWVEVARTILVMSLMVWSVGALKIVLPIPSKAIM